MGLVDLLFLFEYFFGYILYSRWYSLFIVPGALNLVVFDFFWFFFDFCWFLVTFSFWEFVWVLVEYYFFFSANFFLFTICSGFRPESFVSMLFMSVFFFVSALFQFYMDYAVSSLYFFNFFISWFLSFYLYDLVFSVFSFFVPACSLVNGVYPDTFSGLFGIFVARFGVLFAKKQ